MYYIRSIHISRPAQHHHHRSILLVEYSTLEVRRQQTSFYFSEGRVCHLLLLDVVVGLSIQVKQSKWTKVTNPTAMRTMVFCCT